MFDLTRILRVLAWALVFCGSMGPVKGAFAKGGQGKRFADAGFRRLSSAWYRLEEGDLGPGASKMAVHIAPTLSSTRDVQRVALMFHGTSSRLATDREGLVSRFNWHPRVNFARTYMKALHDIGEPLDGVVLVQSSGPSWRNFDWKTGQESAEKITRKLRSLFPSLRSVILEGHSAGYEPMGRIAQAFRSKDARGQSVAVDAFILRDAFYGRPHYLVNMARKSKNGTRLFAFNSTTTTCIAADATMGRLKNLDTIVAGGDTLTVEHSGALYRTYLNIPTEGGSRADTATRHSAIFHVRSPELLQLPFRAMRGQWQETETPPQLERDEFGTKCFWKRK